MYNQKQAGVFQTCALVCLYAVRGREDRGRERERARERERGRERCVHATYLYVSHMLLIRDTVINLF